MGPTHRSLQRTLFPRGRFSSYSFSFRIVTDWELERKNFVFFLLSQGEGKLRRELAISQGGLKTSGEEGSRPGHRWQMSAYRWRVGPEWYSGYLLRIPQGWESIWGTVSDHFTLFFFFFDEPSSSSLLYPFDVSSLKVSGLFSQWNIKLISWVKENGFTWGPFWKPYFPMYKQSSFFVTLQNKELDQSWLVYVERILIWEASSHDTHWSPTASSLSKGS